MRRIATHIPWALAAGLLAACGPQGEPQQKPERLVQVTKVHEVSVPDTVTATGEIRARVQSNLSFQVTGRIIARLVDVGDRVTAGQVLARIDPSEQQADLDVAVASLNSAMAERTQAQQAFDRQQRLFESGVTTRASLDSAQEQLTRAQANVEAAQAQAGRARDALERTSLKADADGVITARSAEVGQVAQASQQVFSLAHDGPLDVVLNLDESVFLDRKLEPLVLVSPLSGGTPAKAVIREISPAIDPSTGTIRVKMQLEDTASLRLGSAVTATLSYQPVPVIELPAAAMASDGGRTAVWVMDPAERKVSLRPVEVLAYSSGAFTVASGVTAGELVVINGTKFLSPGETVSFEEAAQ
ncbi:efflux RND transporter periplasmic adaptor subunit [Pannonibacter phragmitetus]|uniref:Acriflavin resistance protein n=1 Tax=Pannonibacter phragmitetus TaxID=121719 RepID=A0A0U3P3Q2_9HYPH|nr:efflux RND transporter periplasmic adaptor subunit [Pannonibacter phragmitetus]ALV26437.1 acriflavin resistance protein [Pannonibacter phragmitetus]